ncbi:putative beta-lysine N-acetyltransferase [Halodesulfovibrio aestuarii]|uniref:putative beta-lysine N-acetyltransferase n=1 Tax=Halodesulfovibrio aestuarii TaxID=126333 RepID=UPI000424066A
MQLDRVVSVMGNTIQHGHSSNRAYLLKLGGSPDIAARSLSDIAVAEGYSKVIAKVPETMLDAFTAQSFEEEARVPDMYAHKGDGVFVARYFEPERRNEILETTFESVRALAEEKANNISKSLPEGYTITTLKKNDIPEMINVFQQVFKKYPFPVHDAAFIEQTMLEETYYFGVHFREQLVAVSSAEVDASMGNAEMTDFATLPPHRGNGLASCLLTEMESYMRTIGIKTAYTIARAVSPGMNITFARAGYRYCGRLPNNTCIAEGIESMNVWSKAL